MTQQVAATTVLEMYRQDGLENTLFTHQPKVPLIHSRSQALAIKLAVVGRNLVPTQLVGWSCVLGN